MAKTVIGWRERVSLPALGIEQIEAKVDTGARTSALHAFKIECFEKDGRNFVRFLVHPMQRHRFPEILCEAPSIGERVVMSSNGQKDHRYVIETMLRIGDSEWPIEVTLTNRDEMGYRMLLGRQALRRRLQVDPGISYKLGKPMRNARHQGEGPTK